MAKEDTRKRAEDAMAEIDLRLGGLLGKLGDTLGEVIDRLESGDDGEVRRTHEIQTPKGPLKAETGIRLRFGGLASGSAARPAARDPARPVNDAVSRPASSQSASNQPPSAVPAAPLAAAPAPLTPQNNAADRPSAHDGLEASGPLSTPARTPHLEAYFSGNRWVLCADLPGVTLPEVEVRVEDGVSTPTDGTAPITPDAGAAHVIVLQTTGTRRYSARHPVPPEAGADDMQILLRNGILEITLPREVIE